MLTWLPNSSITYPGSTVSYTRGTDGNSTTVTLDGTTLIDSITRKPFGPLASGQLAGSISLTWEYDQRYNLTGTQATGLEYGYTRDGEGHVTAITGVPSPTPSNVSDSYTYTNNQLLEITGSTEKSYTHDDNGNITSDGSHTFTYDELNRIISVEKDGSTLATYGYDSSNRRVRKTIGATTIHYHYDINSQLIAETLSDGTLLREYFYLEGQPLALKEYETTPGTYYYINDHLGTPQQLVTDTGTIVWQAAYLPFGKAQMVTETIGNNIRFPGQYFDSETGLHYNWHRFYDPETGRYISADPIGLAGGINLYAYVQGDPANRIDPKGLIDDTLTPIAIGALIRGGQAVAGALSGVMLTVALDELRQELDGQRDAGNTSIPKPKKPKCGCTCICRADADDTKPGNITPGSPLFQFGVANAGNCMEATKAAKREAIHKLGMKPKHVGCRCNGK